MTVFNTASVAPAQILGNDGQNPAGPGNPLTVTLGTATITAIISANITAVLANGSSIIGTATIDQTGFGVTNRVVAGKTQSTSVTAAMTTTTAYNPNQVVGGLLTFSNALGTSGSGILQTVTMNVKNIQTASFLFTPFNSNPSNSTWTDHSAAAIASTDVFAARDPVSLSGASNILGTASVYSAPGLGIAMAPGSTTVYGILQAVGTTNAFVSTGDIQITVKFLQD